MTENGWLKWIGSLWVESEECGTPWIKGNRDKVNRERKVIGVGKFY